jgi:hypothetical protein
MTRDNDNWRRRLNSLVPVGGGSLAGAATHDGAIDTGYPIGPSSFPHEVRKAMILLEDEFDIRFPMVMEEDEPLRSNPLRVNDMIPRLRERMIDNRRHLADYVPGMIHIYSIGTGLLMWQRISEELNLGASIDFVVQSHLVQTAVDRSKRPAPRRRLLAALAYAGLDDGTILMNQPLQRFGYAGVPRRVAKIAMTAGHFDWGNLENGTYLIGYEEVPIGANHWQAGQSGADQRVNEAVAQTAERLTPEFDPGHWAFWRDDPRDDLPVTDDVAEVYAVLPREYEALGGEDLGFEIKHADVDQPHVLKLQHVDPLWIRELKREAIEHVDAELREDGNTLASEWDAMTRKFGVSDPIARWEKYRERHVDPNL